MPHCIIEYAAPLEKVVDISRLVDGAFTALVDSGLFDPTSIKVRALPFPYGMTGAEQQHHVSTTVKLLPGRTDQQKELLGLSVLEAKRSLLEGKALLSVEVVDISGSYFK